MNDTRTNFFELLDKFDNAMLCTRQSDGTLRARPMEIADVGDNGDLWFVTSVGSGKVEELLHDPAVVATLQSKTRYLSISGRAEVVADQQKINELWKDTWKAWFPEGKSDPSIVLLRIRTTEGEYWDNSGAKGIRYAVHAATAVLKGERADEQGVDEKQHGHVQL